MIYPIRRWLLWLRQGRPRDVPVVMQPGYLAVEGEKFILSDFHFDGHYLDDPGWSLDDEATRTRLWSYLGARYPIHVESHEWGRP